MTVPLGSIITKVIDNSGGGPAQTARVPQSGAAQIKRRTFNIQLRSLDDPKNWVPLKEAAHLLHVSRRTMVRMCETIHSATGPPYVRCWRPTPGTLMICRRSLEEFCRITQNDAHFWEDRGREVKVLPPRVVTSSRRRSQPLRARKIR